VRWLPQEPNFRTDLHACWEFFKHNWCCPVSKDHLTKCLGTFWPKERMNSECAAFQGNQILGETYYKILRIIFALAAKIPNPNSRGILTSGDEIFGEDFWKCFSVTAAGIRFDKTKGLDVDNVVDRVIPLLIDLHDDQCRDTKKNAATGALDVDDMMPEQRKQIDSVDQAAASLAAESELLTNDRKKENRKRQMSRERLKKPRMR
jgi:hypothetical protein